MSDTGRDPEEKAKDLGLVVRYPASNELFVDIDSEEQSKAFDDLFKIFCEHYWGDIVELTLEESVGAEQPPPVFTRTPSPSGKPGRYHVVVTLPRDVPTQKERIIWQALLGSDTKREALAYFVDNRSCFFEKPTAEAAQ